MYNFTNEQKQKIGSIIECKDCGFFHSYIWQGRPRRLNPYVEECNSPKNKRNWFGLKCVPKQINKNNDCEWYKGVVSDNES